MNYSMYLCLAMATVRTAEDAEPAPADATLDVLEPAFRGLQQRVVDFLKQPVSPQAVFELERQMQSALREAGRSVMEWALNQVEPGQGDRLPMHVEFEAGVYTRTKRKTPQDVATVFGKIRVWRYGYRPTQKTGDATIFPLLGQLGVVAWTEAGVWHRVWKLVLAELQAAGRLDTSELVVDGTFVEAKGGLASARAGSARGRRSNSSRTATATRSVRRRTGRASMR